MRLIGSHSLRFPIAAENGIFWSEDDKLALLTSKCVYIYDLLADPGNVSTKMNFRLRFIHSSEEVNPWLMNIGLDREKIVSQALPSELDLINMDKAVSPLMESGKTSFRQFVKGGWLHPQFLSHEVLSSDIRSDESYLVTLTSDHWLRIYAQNIEASEWTLVKDISEVLHSYLKAHYWSESPSDVRTLRERSYAHATVSFFWINEFKMLLVAQKNGDICILDNAFNVIKILKDLHGSEVSMIYAIPLLEDFILLTCGIDGRIKGFVIDPMALDPISLKKDVWSDPDHMTVSKIIIIKNEINLIELAIAKGSFLIYTNIKSNEATVESALSMGSSPVFSMVPHVDGSLIVMSLSGPFSIVTKDKEVQELNGLSEFLDTTHYTNKGLVKSRCGALMVSVQNVSAHHDHLVLRTPLKLTFFTHFEAPSQALESILTAPDFSLKNYRDHIEVARILYLKMEDTIFIEKEGIKDAQFLAWYLDFFKFNQRRPVDEEEIEVVQRCLLKAYIEPLQELKDFMDNQNNFKETGEACVICGSKFTIHKANVCVCSSNHAFPRCALSMRIVMKTHLLQCRWCKSIAHPDSNALLEFPCPICGGPFDK